MITSKVKVDVTGAIAGLRNFEETQAPFLTAAALTATVQDGQQAVKRQVRQAFKLRNNWTEQGIRIKPADSKIFPIQADVHTDTVNRKTGAPDYLGRQEDGGDKVPFKGIIFQGEPYLAVPTRYLRQFAPGIIPNELRPSNLVSAVAGKFAYRNRKGDAVTGRQRVVRGLVFFAKRMKTGTIAILGRVADEKNARDVVPFYILVPEVHIKRSSLEMERTVARVVGERFDRQFQEVFRRAYANGIRI